MEKYKQTVDKQVHSVVEQPTSPSTVVDAILDPLKTIAEMRADHPAVRYVVKRQIPSEFYDKLYFAPKYKKFINSLLPNKLPDKDNDHPRLIIPYFDRHGRCYALQGRAFGNEQPKYQTIKFDDDVERIYGLDRVNYAKRIYVLEGPIDSMFIPNAIAVSGSSFIGPTIEQLKSNVTLVYDNEPRSPQLTRLIQQSIDKGFSVCLWPETIKYKDINEMIVDGHMTPAEIVATINGNTYTGIEAQLRFATWRQCDYKRVVEAQKAPRQERTSKLVELLGV